MKVLTVDGRPMMMNNKEMEAWVSSGVFRRIPDGDGDDKEYCELRDKMLANGDEDYYKSVIPQSVGA